MNPLKKCQVVADQLLGKAAKSVKPKVNLEPNLQHEANRLLTKNVEESKKEKIANLQNNEFFFIEFCDQFSDHKIFMLTSGSSSNKFYIF
jgi:hypothetical protein